MKLIDHRKFFAFVVEDAIKLTNDQDADVFASWKVGGQDFYIYGKAIEGSVCSPCVSVAGTPGDCVPPSFDCRPVCAVYREANAQISGGTLSAEADGSQGDGHA